jgi:hypothetical protein
MLVVCTNFGTGFNGTVFGKGRERCQEDRECCN